MLKNFQANIQKSLETLDVKDSISFFDNPNLCINEDSYAIPHKLGKNNLIWTIENFLIPEECDTIVKKCEDHKFSSIEHLYDKEYRDSQRILSFDKNEFLLKTLEYRLNSDHFIDRLNKHRHKKPFGFFSNGHKWSPNTQKLNECLRIHKYNKDSVGFGWHRDAQYTRSDIVKSNYTLIVYLNDTKGGETEFISPKNSFLHCGYTVEQEMQNIKDNGGFDAITIHPCKGMAVIFDQRLLHKGKKCFDTKYILRTDMLCFANLSSDVEHTDLEKQNEKLTRKLFRQAQYYELESKSENINKTQQLYEICLSLRQHPHKLTSYQQHLENLLEDLSINKQILNNDSYCISFLSRSGSRYRFKYARAKKHNEIVNSIKIAACCVLFSSVRDIDDSLIYDFEMKRILEQIGCMENITFDIETDEDAVGEICEHALKLSKDIRRKIYKKFYSVWLNSDKVYCDFETFAKHEMNIDMDNYTDSYKLDTLKNCFEDFIKKKYPSISSSFNVGKCKSKINNNFVGITLNGYRDNIHICCCEYHTRSCKVAYRDDIWQLKFDNLDMCLKPKSKNIHKGTIRLKTLKKSFNHASCQCESYVSNVDSENVYWKVDLRMSYSVDVVMQQITIEFTPKVIV